MNCTHPKVARELWGGYDIVCGDCHAILGRAAMFPDAVINAPAARTILGWIGDKGEGSSEIGMLSSAAKGRA